LDSGLRRNDEWWQCLTRLDSGLRRNDEWWQCLTRLDSGLRRNDEWWQCLTRLDSGLRRNDGGLYTTTVLLRPLHDRFVKASLVQQARLKNLTQMSRCQAMGDS
jgi:hypothetical protein